MLPPLGEPEDPESLIPSRLPGRPGIEDNSLLSVEEEEGDVTEAPVLRFSLGGTGGTDPTESERERLRLGLVLPTWLGLLLSEDVGAASEVGLLAGLDVASMI